MDNYEERRLGIAHAPDATYEQFVDKWAMEIGRFILAFGSIESTTYMALKLFPRDPIAEPLNKLQLADRIEVLLAIVQSNADPDCLQFAALLNEVKGLVNDRNLVAHNGVGVDVYINPKDFDDLVVVESIRSGRDRKKHLRLERLQESRKRAEMLSRQLHETFDAIRYSGKAHA